jgi:hypothetical protein
MATKFRRTSDPSIRLSTTWWICTPPPDRPKVEHRGQILTTRHPSAPSRSAVSAGDYHNDEAPKQCNGNVSTLRRHLQVLAREYENMAASFDVSRR